MRRSYRGSQTGSPSSSVSHQRSDYLFILRNLQHHDELFSRALGLLGVLASEGDIMQLCEETDFQAAAQAEVKASCLADRTELFDRLAYFMPQKFGSTERAKLKLGRNLVSILCRKSQVRLCWQDNAFLCYLRDNLELSPLELQLLWALYLQQASRELDFLNVGISDLSEELYVLQACFGTQGQLIGELLLRDSKLIATGLVEHSGDIPKIPPRVILAIAGQISLTAFQAENFVRDSASTYELDSFDLNPVDIQIMLALLKSKGPANILLFGKPGCGKSEAARSLIRAAGLDLLHIPVQAMGGRNSRLTRLRYADHFSQGCGIILDEAELILNNALRFLAYESDSLPGKSVLNTYLDSSQSKTIWILNDTNNLHESTMRRFHFKLYFDKLSRMQRQHALNLITRKHGIENLVTPEVTNRLLSEEHLSPGTLDQMAQALVETVVSKPEIPSDAILGRLLRSNRHRDSMGCDENHMREAYSVDALNLSIPAEQIIQSLKKFLALPREPRNGINLLFHGLPGTGKTELARHLSRCLNRDLVIKRGSDLLGMFVGSTEKSIAAAFKQAQQNEAILLLDEADTFFQTRADARQAYEISHTNEFLNQMENHSTILICCTNTADKFDPAALRRFPLKVEFNPLRPDKLAGLFQIYFRDFCGEIPEASVISDALADINNLTPGDFRNVERRVSIAADKPTWQYLANELRQESRNKLRGPTRSIGFKQVISENGNGYSA